MHKSGLPLDDVINNVDNGTSYIPDDFGISPQLLIFAKVADKNFDSMLNIMFKALELESFVPDCWCRIDTYCLSRRGVRQALSFADLILIPKYVLIHRYYHIHISHMLEEYLFNNNHIDLGFYTTFNDR